MSSLSPWSASTPEGRWCGFGPYYAMFPVDFVRQTIARYCPPNGRVIDPFCGRGTTPFVAAMMGRDAFGADINPVAWVYSNVKLDPCKRSSLLMKRVSEIIDCVSSRDREPRNTFQKLAWHRDVLGFLHAARRNLDWRRNRTDRTLMGLILVHLHAKRGEGLSNQLRQSKAMSPDYAVKWWKYHDMKPPKIDLFDFFRRKLEWRYKRGIPIKRAAAITVCGDSREILSRISKFNADLVLTSPPYCGVTNYTYDNWIRLWMLGGPALPDQGHAGRYADSENYEALIADVFAETRRLSKNNATIYVRTDARPFTLETTIDTLKDLWPSHRMSIRFDMAPGKTQTALFQHNWNKAGEVDVLLTPRNQIVPRSFYRS